MKTLTGIGLYSPKQAEKLTGIDSKTIRRWLLSESDRQKPLWKPEPSALGASEAISFRDLLEVQAVSALRKHKVSLQAIRAALINLREKYSDDYPLTNPRLSTDGRAIFLNTLKESGDECMSDVITLQHVMSEVMQPSILGMIHFNENEIPEWWQPDPSDENIRVDPKIGFGKPHVLPSRMPTRTLAQAYEAENGNAKLVARQFEITEDEVIRAANFETRTAVGANIH
ncbi:MerR family transcriptional regulator [Cobetia marina]|uniref:MerR family transcriptional regulator n=1 Tax=Cobetia marina TaxID=28258 RepID=UPI00174EC3D4